MKKNFCKWIAPLLLIAVIFGAREVQAQYNANVLWSFTLATNRLHGPITNTTGSANVISNLFNKGYLTFITKAGSTNAGCGPVHFEILGSMDATNYFHAAYLTNFVTGVQTNVSGISKDLGWCRYIKVGEMWNTNTAGSINALAVQVFIP